jgi:nicotinate-nucleotide adenylyltransferase
MAKPGYPVVTIIGVKEEKHLIPKPLALLGGTFDPVHYAHLRCADEVREKLGLDTLYLLPAGSPPHRELPKASSRQRLEMLRLALPEFPNLRIDARELDRDGPSYMVDTLQDLRSDSPSRPLLLVIGQDAANHLQNWHCWLELFELGHIVIMTRPGARPEYRPELARQIRQRLVADVQTLIRSKAGGVLTLQVTAIDICATTIKSMIRLGKSPQAMLPDPVVEYINDQGLYLL